MSPVLDDELVSYAHSLIGAFISSSVDGTTALDAFLRMWTEFEMKLQNHQSSLQDDTLKALHNSVSIIISIASGLISLEDERETICTQLTLDMTKIVDDKMADLVIRDERPIVLDPSIPAYIKPCCDWLLSNLHNPYPSKGIKSSISRQTGCSVRHIEAWFTDARRRIGWNHLRKTHFSNKQADIIDAAFRVFKPSQGLTMGKSPLHYGMFVAMEQQALCLYEDYFGEARSTSVDCSGSRSKPRSRNSKGTLRSAYPSPTPSPDRTPSPVSSQPCSTYKRCNETSDYFEQSCIHPRPAQSLPSPAQSLPSPASSTPDPDDRDDQFTSESISPSVKVVGKRKRRASDVGMDGSVKKANNGQLSLIHPGYSGSLSTSPDSPLLDPWPHETSSCHLDFDFKMLPFVSASTPPSEAVDLYSFNHFTQSLKGTSPEDYGASLGAGMQARSVGKRKRRASDVGVDNPAKKANDGQLSLIHPGYSGSLSTSLDSPCLDAWPHETSSCHLDFDLTSPSIGAYDVQLRDLSLFKDGIPSFDFRAEIDFNKLFGLNQSLDSFISDYSGILSNSPLPTSDISHLNSCHPYPFDVSTNTNTGCVSPLFFNDVYQPQYLHNVSLARH